MTPAILLVDDDVFLLTLTAELLSGLGYEVTTARNGGEALAVLDYGHAVDLLVTDVQMPGLHGFELARRAQALRLTLAVLYCTGHAEMIGEEMGPPLGPIRHTCKLAGMHLSGWEGQGIRVLRSRHCCSSCR